jgi:hypothetical protein
MMFWNLAAPPRSNAGITRGPRDDIGQFAAARGVMRLVGLRSLNAAQRGAVQIKSQFGEPSKETESGMKIRLQLKKEGMSLYEGIHDVADADSFGRAFAQAWASVRDHKLRRTTSVGQLMELLSDETIAEISGAELIMTKV